MASFSNSLFIRGIIVVAVHTEQTANTDSNQNIPCSIECRPQVGNFIQLTSSASEKDAHRSALYERNLCTSCKCVPQRSISSSLLGNSFPEGQLRFPSISGYHTLTNFSELKLNILFLGFPLWRKGLSTHVLWRMLLFYFVCSALKSLEI
jgi:hypothetical protein